MTREVSLRLRIGILLAALAALTCRPALAEIFFLKNGGSIEGELLNPKELPRTTYRIKTAAGAIVTIANDQVKSQEYVRPEKAEYDRIRPTYPDTVDAHWELSEYCRENHLPTEREFHLNRVIALAPDHADARRILGYRQTPGGWKTEAELRAERGEIFYDGKYRTAQEIELLEQQKTNVAAVQEWHRAVRLWRAWLNTRRAPEAVRQFEAITDPYAIDALAMAMKEEPNFRSRILFVDALARINTPDAIKALALFAMIDDNMEVRLTCFDHLKRNANASITRFFIGYLGHKDNAMVNRAGYALMEMNDPSSIDALIEGLITVHKIQKGRAAGYQATFAPPGQEGGGLTAGGSTSYTWVKMKNPDVLNALVRITGANFEYDEEAWKRWIRAYKASNPPQLDARRDEPE